LLAAPFAQAHLLVMEINTTLSGLEPLIGIEELAEYLGVPIKTLYKWRQEGAGPCSVRVGRHIRYFVSDVRDWLSQQRGFEQVGEADDEAR
jgi:excisionase family DNA binding protein